MGERLKAGSVIPAFCYDTPYEPQKSFYQLVSGETPALFVFFPNFGHPITRHYVMQYLDSIKALEHVRLVCVVQSKPQTIAAAVPKGALPFELICDAEGVLYDYLDIPKTSSKLKSYSLQAVKILREAEKEGYVADKNAKQQLPLTLVVGNEGEVLFAHYGRSLTDLPADCYAMERVAQELNLEPSEQEDWMDETEEWQDSLQPDEQEQFADQTEWQEQEQAEPQQEPHQEIPTENFYQQEPEEPVAPPEKPQPPVRPQHNLEEIIHTSAKIDYQKSDLPRGKIRYPQNRKPKAVDFSELGFDTEK